MKGDDKMSLGDMLYDARKKKGLSQEQAAEKLGVARQTVSKWELGATVPDLEKAKDLALLYEISLDEMMNLPKENHSEDSDKTASVPLKFEKLHYEYVSRRKIGNLPLLHINVGLHPKRAKGVFAIGNISSGIFSLGFVSAGVFSLGILSAGLLSLGVLALGLLSFGAFAAGLFAVGGIAVGYMAIGGLAIGAYSVGGAAIAKNVAFGGYASGHIGIGEKVKADLQFLTGKDLSLLDGEKAKLAIESEFPKALWFVKLIFNSIL